MLKKIIVLITIFIIFSLCAFFTSKFIFEKVKLDSVNAQRKDFVIATVNYFEDYYKYYQSYPKEITTSGGYNKLRAVQDYYWDIKYKHEPLDIPTNMAINIYTNIIDCNNVDQNVYGILYQVSPDGSSYNLKICLVGNTISENFSLRPYNIVVPTSKAESRDQERIAIVRDLKIFLKDNSNFYNKYKIPTISKNQIYDEAAMYEPSFTGAEVNFTLPGIKEFVSHGNCGVTTESSWNIVFEVSEDQQSYDLAACLESGRESKNYSTKPIHNF